MTWDQKQPQQKVNWNPIKSVFILVFEQFYSDVFEIEDGHNSDDAIDNNPFVILLLPGVALKSCFCRLLLSFSKRDRCMYYL